MSGQPAPSTPPPAPTVDEVLAGLRVVSLPMRVPFRGVTVREVALVVGPAGWGEFGPFLEYGPVESARWLASALESAYGAWPGPVRAMVPVNATVPAVVPEAVPGVLARFPGCTTAKVKVAERGQSLADDLDRVAAVRAAMGPTARIRVDANGGWTVDEASGALGRLAAYGLEYAEQPCAAVEDLARVRVALARNGIDVPIAADESIRKAEDPLRVRDLAAADLIVVKVAPLGGVRRALEIVAATGLPAVVSSALDTSVGIAAGVALAAALPSLDHACGLGTVSLLGGDVASGSLVPVDGRLPVGRVAADPDLLDRWAAPPDRTAWWRQRVTDCWQPVE
jgi:O-succinylbenzoate synthase